MDVVSWAYHGDGKESSLGAAVVCAPRRRVIGYGWHSPGEITRLDGR
jgi:hypothetical protein